MKVVSLRYLLSAVRTGVLFPCVQVSLASFVKEFKKSKTLIAIKALFVYPESSEHKMLLME